MFNLKNFIFSIFLSKFLNIGDSKRHFMGKNFHISHNIYITTDDNKKIGAYLFKPEHMNGNTEFINVLHGTGSSRDCYGKTSAIQLLNERGYYLLIPDYRGFDDSGGDFAIRGVNLDILACFKYIASEFGIRKVHVIGHSLGTGIIAEYCRYAKENNIEMKYRPNKVQKTCIFGNLLKFLLPWFELRMDRDIGNNTIENIKYMNSKRLFIYHCQKDPLVPYKHSLTIIERYNDIFLKLTHHTHNH